MSVLESLQTDPDMRKASLQAHLTRTKDRITAWKAKLDTDITEDEQLLIEEELVTLERQLITPVTERTLSLTPQTTATVNPLVGLVMELRTELESLKAKFTGKGSDGAVSQSETPA